MYRFENYYRNHLHFLDSATFFLLRKQNIVTKYPNLDQKICVALKAITIHIYTLFRLNHILFVVRENNIVTENTNLDR